jgi:predicted O-methyltransferase YrrM
MRRYDAVLEGYVPARERRFEVMIELVAALAPPGTVVDLGAGPGALAGRLLHRLPAARVVAVDADPVLVDLGRRVHADLGGRLRWVESDLRAADWVPALEGEPVGAVVSASALHYLAPGDLVPLYRRLAGLLQDGGLVVNGDLLPGPSRSPALGRVAERREAAAGTSGGEDWAGWWDALRAEPGLAAAFDVRRRSSPPGPAPGSPAGLDVHRAALAIAGFRDVAVVWQDLEERVLLAVR